MTTLLDRLAEHASRQPERTALVFPPGRSYTWAQLYAAIGGIAAHLAQSGVLADERVAILSEHPEQQVLGFLGAMGAGASPTILSHPSIKQSVERFVPTFVAVLERGTRWVVCSDELATRMHDVLAERGVRALSIPAALPPPASVRASPTAFVQYSSGTTGMRKGVAVSASMLEAQARDYLATLAFGADDIVASWLPLYHDMGLVACLLLPLWAGACSVHLSPFRWVQNPALLLDLVAEHRATFAWMPNFAFRVIADRLPATYQTDLSSLRAVINCGEPTRGAAHDAFFARCAKYGLAETALQCCYALAENTFAATQSVLGRIPRRRGELISCGPPVGNASVRIADNAETGEVELVGPSLFAGYDGGAPLDGWFRTGDLGTIVDGELYVTGRIKDLIIHRGVNLYPEDIEEAVAGVPGGKPGRAVAFGVFDDAAGTESIVVLVEPMTDESSRLALDVRARIFEVFGLVPVVEVVAAGSLVKSTSGKPSRSANRAAYLARRG